MYVQYIIMSVICQLALFNMYCRFGCYPVKLPCNCGSKTTTTSVSVVDEDVILYEFTMSERSMPCPLMPSLTAACSSSAVSGCLEQLIRATGYSDYNGGYGVTYTYTPVENNYKPSRPWPW
ncbi:hypothetical protein B566_EDAN007074 [Ephemera danica]|nr:hypothetical protein B566_EDAN007074 [Ephemera danica]